MDVEYIQPVGAACHIGISIDYHNVLCVDIDGSEQNRLGRIGYVDDAQPFHATRGIDEMILHHKLVSCTLPAEAGYGLRMERVRHIYDSNSTRTRQKGNFVDHRQIMYLTESERTFRDQRQLIRLRIQ